MSKIDQVKDELKYYEGLEYQDPNKVVVEALSAYLVYLENRPLTMSEIEKMVGDPIYITSLCDDGSIEYGYWTIVPTYTKSR